MGTQKRRMGVDSPLPVVRRNSSNRVAADDNPALLMSIAVRPLADPPFPMSTLEQQFGNKTD